MATSLGELSRELNISESGLRKRIKTLGLEVEKGARGKWLLSEEMAAALKQADHAMKNGAGEVTIRRIVGFAPDQPRTPESTEHPAPGTNSAPADNQAVEALTTDKTGDIASELEALHRVLSTAHSGPPKSGEDSTKAFDLLADAYKRIEALHAEKEAALRELADTKALVGTFQERSENLKARNEALEGEIKLLMAPKDEPKKAWWKLW